MARARRASLRALAGLLAAGLAAAAPDGGEPDPETSDCMLEPSVYRYLSAAQDRILEHWELPPDGMADREVVVRLVFEGDGSLRSSRVVSTNDRRLARSVQVAILRATPFPPMPRAAGCLVGRSIQTTLRNPSDGA